MRNNRRLPRFAKINMVGIIVGVKRAGKRKMDEPSEGKFEEEIDEEYMG